ncbi:MAG: hypothetical protein IPJ19_09905 [Planctomycetes bacterium]|nr:hypothetical protein [Planctomycetota bacterium]
MKRSAERWALWGRSPAEVEHANLRDLEADGLPVPHPLGWDVRRERLARCSVVAMERIEHTQTLRDRLFRAPEGERRDLAERLLTLVVRLHAAGWYHRDLYLQHLVLREEELVLLDVGRARRDRAPRRRWFVKDLAALLHSTPRNVSVRARLEFLARYLDARGITRRAERRAWLAAILRRAERTARHTPRHGETRPWEDL